jgi:regulation of enolase protein 1 (concanavalin A-like superfamily)
MSSYTTVVPREPSDGRAIWSAAIAESHDSDSYSLYVLTAAALHWAVFGDAERHQAALEAVRDGADPRAALGRGAASIPLGGVTRVEKRAYDNGISVKTADGGGYVPCPDRLARVIFKALQQRCHPRLRFRKKRQLVLAAALEPLGVLVVVWLVAVMLWAFAHSDERPGGEPRVRTKAEAGARILGNLLGPTIPLVLGGLVSVGVVGWGVVRIFTRGPFKKVLQPSAWGGGEAQESEDEDEDRREGTSEPVAEEPSPALRVACTACGRRLRVPGEMAGRSVRCPGCRGVVAVPPPLPSTGTVARQRSANKRPKSAPQSGGKVGLILGAVALALGILALTLSLFTFQPALVLPVAGVGLLVGGAGVVLVLKVKGANLGLPITGGAVSVLALVLEVVLLLASPAQPDAAEAPFAGAPGERGRAGNVDAPGGQAPAAAAMNWGEPLDPDGDCTLTPQGDSLSISVPPTPHDILADKAGKSNAPRVLREVEGDFRVQVKVCGSLQPRAKGSIPGRLPFQAAGLLVWGDQDNFLRLVRTGQVRKGNVESIAAFRLRAQGKPNGGKVLAIPDADAYLRLERKGDQVLGSYSPDGRQWTPLGTLPVSFPSKVRVGVMVLNTVQDRLTVRFEELQIGR